MFYYARFVYILLSIMAFPLAASEKPAKKTVCLNMIVKDESAVIKRCLESVKPLIDTWVIVDTGSRDGTQGVIKQYLKDIPGELHERPWVNFGHNRNEALLLAKGKADYILFMDADDTLKFAEDFVLPELTKDFYATASRSSEMEWVLPRFIKSDLNWHWEGVLHEYITSQDTLHGDLLPQVEYVYHSDGARSHDQNRYLKDIKILREALKKEPKNAHYLFYLAVSYESAGDLDNALKTYKIRETLEGSQDEIYFSKLHIAKIQDSLGLDPKVVEASYIATYKAFPFRIEPLYYLIQKARLAGAYQKAYDMASLALFSSQVPAAFKETWIYTYGLLYEYALAAYHMDKYRESLDACTYLLKLDTLPIREEVIKQVDLLNQVTFQSVQSKLLKWISPS